MFIDFRERVMGEGVGGGRGRGRGILIGYLSHMPGSGLEPAAFSVYGMMLPPTKPPGQGSFILSTCIFKGFLCAGELDKMFLYTGGDSINLTSHK